MGHVRVTHGLCIGHVGHVCVGHTWVIRLSCMDHVGQSLVMYGSYMGHVFVMWVNNRSIKYRSKMGQMGHIGHLGHIKPTLAIAARGSSEPESTHHHVCKN